MRYKEWFQRTNKRELEILYKALTKGITFLDEMEAAELAKIFRYKLELAEKFLQFAEEEVGAL